MLEKILAAIEQQTALFKTSSENQTQFIARMGELDTRLKELEHTLKPRKVSLPGVNECKEKFSFIRAVAAIKTGEWKEAGFEKEVFDQTRQKALETGVGSAGGFIVPIQQVFELIEMLYANTVVIAMGATVLNDLMGSPWEVPKQTGGATAFWVGENKPITESEQTLGQLQLTPKAVAALVKLSNRLLKLSNPSAEAMIRRDIAMCIALAIDYAALRGSGGASQPLGIANTPGILTLPLAADGGDFYFEQASDMEGKLEDANALKGTLGYVMHGKVKRRMKKLRIPQYFNSQLNLPDPGGEYVMLPMSDVKLRDALGYDLKTTTQLPTNLAKGQGTNLSEVYFANWTEMLVGQWGGLEILASAETSDAFAKNQTWVRVIQEVDVGLRHSESFCLCPDAKTQ